MSLENEVARLANAVAMHEDVAVREIIRQRDDALKQADKWKRDADFYMNNRDSYYKSLEAERRRNAALRGVITKMRKEKS